MLIALTSHSSKVMLKILQARLQQYVNRELPDVQVGFIKGRGTRNQIVSNHWIHTKSKGITEKHLLLLYWLCQSLCSIHAHWDPLVLQHTCDLVQPMRGRLWWLVQGCAHDPRLANETPPWDILWSLSPEMAQLRDECLPQPWHLWHSLKTDCQMMSLT